MAKQRIAQILYGRVHHVFEGVPDETWTTDAHGKPIPSWPPDGESNPVLLLNVTGQNINEGAGYNPDMKKAVPMPMPAWNEKTYVFDMALAAESDTTGINS